MEEVIKVIYIEGPGHSGSTLLDLIIGTKKGFESVGEIIGLVEKLDIDCTCGEKISDCTYWQGVNDILKKNTEKELSDLNIRTYDDYDLFEKDNYELYRAILESAGSNVIIDSSKSRKRLRCLIKSNKFDVYTIRIIKDSRANLYSYKKVKNRGKVGIYQPDTRSYKNIEYPYSPVKDSIKWVKANVVGEIINMLFVKKFIRIRYEDLCEDTNKCIKKIEDLTGEDLSNLYDISVLSSENHNVGGNRMRLGQEIKIKKDVSWKTGLTKKELLVNFSIAGWLNKLYGYRK